MSVPDELQIILDRIANHEHSETDIVVLREWLASNCLSITQKGKYALYIERGRDIQIGDRIYRGADAKAIRKIVRSILKELRLSTPTSLERVEQAFLKAVASEVKSRLGQSLHNKVYIELDKEQDPNQVQASWDMELKTGKNPSEQLPAGTKIETIFDREDINGKLLILGVPGSGKTTTVLELAKVLVARAQKHPQLPIPVLLNLSSWKDDKQSIADWMAAALKLKYGLRVDIGKKFVSDRRVLPLLDGLDELTSERQEGCVNKINEFLQEWIGDLVVCSRTEEYKHYEALLGLHNSIVLQPLRREQIQDYVQNKALLRLIEGDVDLMELAQIPLMLNIMVIASIRFDFQQSQQLASARERLDYLFDAYINTVLGQPRCKAPSLEQTRHWLGWLAIQLIRENETEFLIEKIQPCWLKLNIQRMYGLILGLIGLPVYWLILGLTIGAIYGSIFGLIYGPIVGLILGVMVGLFLGLIYALIYGLIYPLIYPLIQETIIGGGIKTAETLKWDWKKIKELLPVLSIGLIAMSIVVPIMALIGGPIAEYTAIEVMSGMSVGMIIAAIVAFTTSLVGAEIEDKTVPNQGIRQSVVNVRLFLAISYLPSIALLFIILRKILGLDVEWWSLLIASFGMALFNGMVQSRASIQHFTLRLVLWWNGYAPWNYARFLDYATDRLLMQRVGGGYRFLHDLLRQHFAKHYN